MAWLPSFCRVDSLSELNRRLSGPAAPWTLPVAVFILSSLFFIGHTRLRHDLDAPPTVGGDSPDYDTLGWELSQERGFRRHFADPQFRAPYEAAGTAHALPLGEGLSVDRPPLYPLLLAAGNRLFGRGYWWVRIAQGLMLGGAAAIAARLAVDGGGVMPGILAAVTFTLVDWRTRWSAREILTESLACWLVALLGLLMVLWWRYRRYRWIVLAGVVLGLTTLCRTMTVLWWPVLMIAVGGTLRRQGSGREVVAAGTLCSGAVLVCLPWFIRNCQVLGEFRPLGTQGAEQFAAAYSDAAYRNAGMWFNLDDIGFFESIDEADPVQRALSRARLSVTEGRSWMARHPLRAALLFPLRVLQEFRPHGPGDLLVLLLAVLGLRLWQHRPEGWVGLSLLLAQGMAVAATWSVAGRFVIPLLGVLHAAAGVGLWGCWVLLVERAGPSRPLVLRDACIPESLDAPG